MDDWQRTQQQVIEHWRTRWEDMELTDDPPPAVDGQLVDMVEDHVSAVSGRIVVDVGCGKGNLAFAFARRGAISICLDTAFAAVAHSVSRINTDALDARGVVGSGFSLPFSDNSIDIVVSGGLLEHFDRALRVEMLKEMKRVSRGCVVAMVPNGLDPFYRFAKWHLQATDRWPWGREHSLQGLGEEFAAAGLSVRYEGSYDFHNSAQLFGKALDLKSEQTRALLQWARQGPAGAHWCGYRLVSIGIP